MRPAPWWLAGLALLAACAAPVAEPARSSWAQFAIPQLVSIEGYDGDAMEPFLSRDGLLLFFNNRNEPPEQTDIHWAERIDDLHFRYRGKLQGVNSDALDGVATLSANGRFCFISPRAYQPTLATIHCGQWTGDRVADVKLQTKGAALIPGRVVFDVELDASGEFLILADGKFTGGPVPASADLRLARSVDDEYRLDPLADHLFDAINTPALEYAASLSADGLTLSFTRLEGRPPLARTTIWLAHRDTRDAAFGAPIRIESIDGFVEAATFAPDGAIYFHKRDGSRFRLQRSAPGFKPSAS
jgi:hypothetical protein